MPLAPLSLTDGLRRPETRGPLRLLANPDTPLWAILRAERLLASRSARQALVTNPRAPQRLLDVVLNYPNDAWTIQRVVTHPNATADLLSRCVDENAGGYQHLSTLLTYVIAHPNAPVERFAGWSRSQNANIRRMIASDSRTPTDVLVHMAAVESVPFVMRALLENGALPQEDAVLLALKAA